MDGGRNLSVLIDGAWVQGGAGGGAGVRFLDGAANLLDNRGVNGVNLYMDGGWLLT